MIRPLAAACLLGLLLIGHLQAAEVISGSRTVEIRMTLLDVEEVNSARQSFTANIAVALRWWDEGLVHQSQSSIGVPLTEIWYPSIQILNQQTLTATFPKVAEVQPDGTATYRQRYWGTFSQSLNLARFPFDSQKLRLTLANVGFGTGDLTLIPSPESGIAEQFTMPDWKVKASYFDTLELPFETDAAQVKGLEFTLEIERNTNYFKYKVIMPLVLIVMMSWMVFWIDPSLVASQISVSVTAMLTMIAYRFALAGYIPRLGYLTSLDLFVVVSTLAVFLAMLEVVLTAYLATSDRLETARRIDLQARWFVPLIFLILAVDTLFFRILF